MQPGLYRATNCLRNENIVPVNRRLHCAKRRSAFFVTTNHSLAAVPLRRRRRLHRYKCAIECCLFRLVPILNLRLNNDLLFDLDYAVSWTRSILLSLTLVEREARFERPVTFSSGLLSPVCDARQFDLQFFSFPLFFIFVFIFWWWDEYRCA